MGKVVLDAEMRAKLNGLTQQLELYDEQGNLLAYCTPAEPGLDSLPGHSGPNPFSDAEIDEAMKDTDAGRPLTDILTNLRRQCTTPLCGDAGLRPNSLPSGSEH